MKKLPFTNKIISTRVRDHHEEEIRKSIERTKKKLVEKDNKTVEYMKLALHHKNYKAAIYFLTAIIAEEVITEVEVDNFKYKRDAYLIEITMPDFPNLIDAADKFLPLYQSSWDLRINGKQKYFERTGKDN